MKKTLYTCIAIIGTGLCIQSVANTVKYSDWNEDTVKMHIQQSKSGNIESTQSLFHYYRNYYGGNDHKEALCWLNIAREQVESSSLETEEKSKRLVKIDKLIEHEKATIARLNMSSEELNQHIESAKKSDLKSILVLCNYYEYNKQIDQAIFWLKEARTLVEQKSTDEKAKEESLQHFDYRIEKLSK